MAVAATEDQDLVEQVPSEVDAMAETQKAVRKFDNTDVAASATYTWEVRDWAGLGRRVVSPVFECGNQRWQILLFPQGNPNSHTVSHVALYLEALGPRTDEAAAVPDSGTTTSAIKRKASDAEYDSSVNNSQRDSDSSDDPIASEKAPAQWPHTCASFAMRMWNPEHPEVHVTQAANHRYRPNVHDWGYNEFTFIRSAFVRRSGDPAALISPVGGPDSTNLGVNITVAIDVLDDPTGVLWHDLSDYDSRTATGYTGLVNQGATCYLNSLLQSLYFTKVFRNAVYKIPDSKGVTGGLQRLFYMLSTSHPAVDTTSLTRAFGWDSADAFTQHDVQELARVLMDRLETKMKDTTVDGFLSRIFVGEMKSYIKCQNVPFESSRTEEFWDVQLNVRGMRDVVESFRAYCAEEMLEGDNQYAAGEYGLQDAVKGVVFRSFPPVLHLQLKRYDYDWMHDVEVKINDRYEFPLELDLTEFTESKSGDWKYALHGVLVHSGDLNAGHYYALIKPEANGGWFRFDDEHVTKATLREVLDENFGGEGSGLRRITSAYMLVYVRVSELDFVLGGNDAVPQPVAEHIEAEQKVEKLRAQALAEQQQLMTVKILDTSTLKHHEGQGFAPWSSRIESEFETPITTKVRIGTPVNKLAQDIGAESLWLVEPPSSSRKLRTPSRPRHIPSDGYFVEQLAQWSDNTSPVVMAVKSGDPSTQRLVFVKKWNGSALRLLDVLWIGAKEPLNSSLGVPAQSRVYLEPYTSTQRRSSLRLVSINSDFSPDELNIQPADMLIITEKPGLEEYFDSLAQSVRLHVAVDSVENDGYEIEVSKMDSYATLARKIGDAVGLDSGYIQLYNSLPSQNWRSVAVKSDGSNLDQRLWATSADPIPVRVRSLPVPLVKFEELSEVSLYWLPEGVLGRERRREVLSPPNSKCPIFSESSESVVMLNEVADSNDTQAVWVAMYSRRARELENPAVGSLAAAQAEGFDIFAAPLPRQEIEARKASGAKLVTAFQFAQVPGRAHGVPFQFAVVPDEPFKTTKLRLLELLRKEPDRGLEKIKFAIVTEKDVTHIGDDTVLSRDLPEFASLGIDHPARRISIQQQAIRID